MIGLLNIKKKNTGTSNLIFSDNFANYANWYIVNITPSLSNGLIIDYSNSDFLGNIKNKFGYLNPDNYEFTNKFEIISSSYNFYFGQIGEIIGLWAKITNNTISINTYRASTHAEVSCVSGNITISNGDIIEAKLKRVNNNFTLTVINITTNQIAFITIDILTTITFVSQNKVYPSLTEVGIGVINSAIKIISSNYTCVYNASPVYLIGDSITQGYYADVWRNSFAGKLKTKYKSNIIINGNGSAATDALALYLNEILHLNPRLVISALGTNDINRNQSAGYLTRTASFASNMDANNLNYKICNILPGKNNGLDVSSVNATLNSTYGNKIIDIYSCIDAVNGYADLLHPNTLGMSQIFQRIDENI